MSEDRPTIYTICTIENLESRISPYGEYDISDEEKRFSCKDLDTYFENSQSTRTPGFYFKLEDAIRAVESNACDIYEGSYKHVVIESIGQGVYAHPDDEIWFEWRGTWDEGGYERIAKPESTKCTCNWGIG